MGKTSKISNNITVLPHYFCLSFQNQFRNVSGTLVQESWMGSCQKLDPKQFVSRVLLMYWVLPIQWVTPPFQDVSDIEFLGIQTFHWVQNLSTTHLYPPFESALIHVNVYCRRVIPIKFDLLNRSPPPPIPRIKPWNLTKILQDAFFSNISRYFYSCICISLT